MTCLNGTKEVADLRFESGGSNLKLFTFLFISPFKAEVWSGAAKLEKIQRLCFPRSFPMDLSGRLKFLTEDFCNKHNHQWACIQNM